MMVDIAYCTMMRCILHVMHTSLLHRCVNIDRKVIYNMYLYMVHVGSDVVSCRITGKIATFYVPQFFVSVGIMAHPLNDVKCQLCNDHWC